MGTVTSRKRRDGSIGYTAQIAAKAWLQKREAQLREPGALERVTRTDPPLAEVIDRYIEESEYDLGRTKAQVLASIKRRDIGALTCSAIGSAEIVAFARELQVEPQTRGNYLSHLSAIFAVARPAWNYPLEQPQVP